MTATAVGTPIVSSVTHVVSVQQLSQTFTRLVLAGPELGDWSDAVVEPGTAGDAYIKVCVPPPGGPGIPPYAHDIRAWRMLPEAERGWVRTYTVRRADTVELDGQTVPALTVDVVRHPGQDEGPGSALAATVQVGDTIRLLGPGQGHARWGFWAPGGARRVLCAGDETALPALLAIAEELAAEPEGSREVTILIEVPSREDADAFAAEATDAVRFLVRDGEPGHALVGAVAEVLGQDEQAVAEVLAGRRPQTSSTAAGESGPVDEEPNDETPEGRVWGTASGVTAQNPYLFLAAESSIARALRRLAVDGAGIPRESVSFMGYWRRGVAEG